MSASNNTTKQKKVRYEAGTKGSSSHHRSSRDSGVGSSSASDRASLGTTPNPSSSNPNHFSTSQIETQRLNLRAVQEALDAANERIRYYEASTAQLNAALSESNKENRLLKREKSELFLQVRELQEDLEEERERCERLRRESSLSLSSSRQSPPRSSPRNSREIEEAAAASFARESARRSGYQQQQQQQGMYPAAPQPPANPFLPSPRNSSSGVPVVTAFATSPSAASYSTAPPGAGYGIAHSSMPVRSRYEGSGSGRGSSSGSGSKSSKSGSGSVVNDGKYHLSPL
ncbi:hypothetical protein BKA65DRAFT_477624 [Rhexocercosporidium sp. MPI-PUGE-AT-0058]|nr:hypothetical protein BKA65DRAFT_477624 [Rhexocercosporidium sp. MPI-PUGE-AT-0058]